MTGGTNDFATSGYATVAQLLPRASARLITQYALLNRNLPDYYAPERDYNSWGRYADAMGESLLVGSQAAVEAATRLSLYPAYSYLRIYCTGSELPPHTDRPSCEISVTLTLGGEAAAVWPIWVRGDRGARAVELPPGDALIYRGATLTHWRERFGGGFWVQVFLHYVRRDGDYADYRFDRRWRLGPLAPGEKPGDRGTQQIAATEPCPCGSGRLYGECHGRLVDIRMYSLK